MKCDKKHKVYLLYNPINTENTNMRKRKKHMKNKKILHHNLKWIKREVKHYPLSSMGHYLEEKSTRCSEGSWVKNRWNKTHFSLENYIFWLWTKFHRVYHRVTWLLVAKSKTGQQTRKKTVVALGTCTATGEMKQPIAYEQWKQTQKTFFKMK